MNVEGFGDGADGFPLLDEFEGQFLLITAKLTRTAEGDPAFAGVDETVLSALSDARRRRQGRPQTAPKP